MVDLKPCPFCNQAAEVREWDWPYVRFQVRCSYCRAAPGNRKADKSKAILAWNTRANDERAAVVAHLEARAAVFRVTGGEITRTMMEMCAEVLESASASIESGAHLAKGEQA